MSASSRRRGAWLAERISAGAFLVVLLTVSAPVAADEPIGAVFGEQVYRNQLRSDEPSQLHSELHSLFTTPVLRRYQAEHQAQITPSTVELEQAAAFFNRQQEERMVKQRPKLQAKLAEVNAQLDGDSLTDDERTKLERNRTSLQMRLEPQGETTAKFLVAQSTWQRYLYENYGGGRVLFQQFGLEAFDAMHHWLLQREEQGDFQISDEELRRAFYAYWTTHDHGAFLSEEPEQIEALTTPIWLKEQSEPAE